eukprot:EG_transcript_11759
MQWVQDHMTHALRRSFGRALLRALLDLGHRHRQAVPSTGRPCRDAHFVREAAYFMKFAVAVYGERRKPPPPAGHPPPARRPTDPAERQRRRQERKKAALLQRLTGLAEEDVLHCEWDAEAFRPAWLLLRDRPRRALVLAVRGTASTADLLADLTATPVPCTVLGLRGHVHAGMRRASEQLGAHSGGAVEQALRANPGFHLVCVGHSLGAGVAALHTLALAEALPAAHVRCFGYGTPAVLSVPLATRAAELGVHSCVLGPDIVPRLSYHSLNNVCDLPLIDLPTPTASHTPMLPPGRLYQLWSPTDRLTDCRLEHAEAADVAHIVLAPHMFRDHLVGNYARALAASLAAVEADPFPS